MFRSLPPPPDLVHAVEAGVRVDLPPDTPGQGHAGHTLFPALPHAMLTVTWPVAVPQTPPAPVVLFHTLSTRPTRHDHPDGLQAVGLLVRPAAAACLLGAGPGVLTDAVLPWVAVAGPAEAATLAEALCRAHSTAQRLAALTASLRRSLARAAPPQRWQTVARLCRGVGRHGLAATTALGLGPRQLQRHCQAYLGVSPKAFERLVRLHGALSQALTQAATPGAGPLRGAALAQDAGYADQSHLGRDLRQLAGGSLGQLLAQAQPEAAHWPLAWRARHAAPGGAHGLATGRPTVLSDGG
ncbi:AraC family transcriptional regulator [Ideonella livida]|uniref:AraC family transcriptional regulator n=1 Tax=Ideonella livida TaxID=2707176 RepID=A0A7C9TN65_9BURK|nr:helix-turn-helix domain-containing protein [Ideonella livida]NDY93784.1 AraC family transcriptional regulator [Ideonella livida]